MAGSQGEKNEKSRKCAPNVSGHVYRCAVCVKQCSPFVIDGDNLIPVCQSCWSQIGASNKLLIVAFFRNAKANETISSAVREFINHNNIVKGSFSAKESN
jgi:hypothetical protein